MTMVRCIDCGQDIHISGYWAWTFENVEGEDLPEIGLCEECLDSNKVRFMESILTEEQKKKISEFADTEFKRFKEEFETSLK